MLKLKLFLLLILCSISKGYCQEIFEIEEGRKSTRINFQLVNNAIIIPVELNGVQLSFLLDTGVQTTVLLNLDEQDTLELQNAYKVQLRGLGGGELINAFRSHQNVVRIGGITSKNLTLFTVFDSSVNFSPRLGIPVHGIIGHDFFKDFIVEINYSREFLRLHDPARFKKKLRRYSKVDLQFFDGKPYVKSEIEVGGERVRATFMVDNGLGDAVWIFNDTTGIKVPKKSFEDLLGLGFLGDVRGKRSRISSLSLGDHQLNEVTAAFPDSASVQGLRSFEERNGSVGGEILKRFNMYVDYQNQRMYLRKNKFFKQPFNYDMSGIMLEHSGFVIVETLVKVVEPTTSGFDEGKNVFDATRGLRRGFELHPNFTIVSLREGSPAARAGLEVGDVILSVNGKGASGYNLQDLSSLFAVEEGKKIRLKIKRGEEELKFSFRLKKIL